MHVRFVTRAEYIHLHNLYACMYACECIIYLSIYQTDLFLLFSSNLHIHKYIITIISITPLSPHLTPPLIKDQQEMKINKLKYIIHIQIQRV